MVDAMSALGWGNKDPRNFLLNGQWVDPRTVDSPALGGVTYAGPADANGYIAGQAPTGATPSYMGGGPSASLASWGGNTAPAAAPAPAAASPGGTSSGGGWDSMADAITRRVNSNLTGTVMPRIRSAAIAAGDFGGSRQGVLESNAIRDSTQALTDSLAGAWMQNKSLDNSYSLGQWQLQLGNRNADINQAQVGANLWNTGNQGIGNIGNGMNTIGGYEQSQAWNPLNNMANLLRNFTGYGTTEVSNSSQGGGLSGALGGLIGGANLAKQWGWI